MNIKFNNWLCKVVQSQYENGRVCIRLQDVATQAWVAMATVNMPHIELAEDEIIINNHAENAGILRELVQARIINSPHRLVLHNKKCMDVCTLQDNLEEIPRAFSLRYMP